MGERNSLLGSREGQTARHAAGPAGPSPIPPAQARQRYHAAPPCRGEVSGEAGRDVKREDGGPWARPAGIQVDVADQLEKVEMVG